MTASGALLVRHRSSTYHNIKSTSYQLLKRHRRQAILSTPRRSSSVVHIDNNIMSKALIRDLDLKMQQMKEYGVIAHGYHNENVQYPVHVRRSHDGEKIPRTLPILDRQHRTNCFTNTTILTSSPYENQTSLSKRKSLAKRQQQQLSDDQQLRTFIVPPNKTVNDIDPSITRDPSYTTGKSLSRYYYHRKSSSSTTTSSPVLCSLRPHSIACLSTTDSITTTTTDSCESTKTCVTTDDQQLNPSQSSINQSTSRTPIRTITQKFFSKLFHSPSKS